MAQPQLVLVDERSRIEYRSVISAKLGLGAKDLE